MLTNNKLCQKDAISAVKNPKPQFPEATLILPQNAASIQISKPKGSMAQKRKFARNALKLSTKKLNDIFSIGVWRSWLARPAGGGEVAGSSPATPTSKSILS